ncbi:hypothetical protein LOTGIDRAFT_153008 [Lottia gigantea]|uniref:Secreted protein n=1 Tax=Lottia gigantea TaxID=225164 RepID=V4AWK6_LOTGI|nr:hypothetical protein LOTGIDRAFT_153008 [Lottia gigantea]ESO97901.1 hypothetical protein LOTGIDRAFT_153008 [Lottia gigantea]
MGVVWNFGIFFCAFILFTLFGNCESRPDPGELTRNGFYTDADGHDYSSEKSLLINDPKSEFRTKPSVLTKITFSEKGGWKRELYSGIIYTNFMDRLCQVCRYYRKSFRCILRYC